MGHFLIEIMDNLYALFIRHGSK
ncbi:hypothetical protein LKS17_13495 [Rhizobium petrolearium]|nr:hypothetical protein [Neorhizobium petrolearium]